MTAVALLNVLSSFCDRPVANFQGATLRSTDIKTLSLFHLHKKIVVYTVIGCGSIPCYDG